MIKRNGFVSNSSSTSFLILGKLINFYDITDENIKDQNIFINTQLESCDGLIGCKLTEDIHKYIHNENLSDLCKFVKIIYCVDTSDAPHVFSLDIEKNSYDIISAEFNDKSKYEILKITREDYNYG